MFKNASGDTILAANLAVTTESGELKVTAGSAFATTVSVDVTLDLADTAYTKYAYSMDITGLPDWLKVSGEIASSDSSVKGAYHHEFKLTGTPTASSKSAELEFVAMVNISGASSSGDLVCSADKTITLTPSSSGGNSGNSSSGGNDPYSDSGGSSETPSNGGSSEPPSNGENSEPPADPGNNSETPSNGENSEPPESGGEVAEVHSDELQVMTDEQIAESFQNTTALVLTGEVSNISETIARIETLTSVKTLDLSQVSGVTELKLENTTLESISFAGNQSITTVEIIGNDTLTMLDLTGSNVETVNVEGCSSLTTLDVAGAENLTALNVKATKITALDVKDCSNLTMIDAKGCEDLESVNLEGCESLEYLDVSETKLTELDANGCSNLGTLYCASCDLKEVRLDGCDRLDTLDCSHNSLPMLNASGLRNLSSLRCEHQRIYNKPLSRLMNFLDLLLSQGIFSTSAAEEENGAKILENVRNLKAYDSFGNELSANLDKDSGEITFSGEPDVIAYNYDTGFESMMMDVEVYPSESQEGEEDDDLDDPGDPCGGCSSGFKTEALGVLMLMLLWPRRKA